MPNRRRNPERSRQLIKSIAVSDEKNRLQWYREFVYVSGGIEKEEKARIPDELIEDVVRYHGKLSGETNIFIDRDVPGFRLINPDFSSVVSDLN